MELQKERIERLKIATKHIIKIEKRFKPLIKNNGPCTWNTLGSPFQILIKSVIGQQLSTKAAFKLEEKFANLFPNLNYNDPKKILNLKMEQWSSIGISNAKKETIIRISSLYHEKSLSDEILKNLNDIEVIDELTKIKGVGPWTAEMVLIFGLDRWDHFSVGDLILRRGIEKWIGIPEKNKKEIISYTNQFSPYKTVLSWYLWADFDGGAGGWS
jgi:DNA-3-methyladenine glycosylase II